MRERDLDVLRPVVVLFAFAAFACSCVPPGPVLPPERHARHGCFDLAIAASHDVHVPSTSLLLDVEVENTCGRAELFDLRRLDLFLSSSAGEKHKLTLYDPRSEIVPLHVDGHADAFERVRADGAGDDPDFRTMCFSQAGLAPNATPAPDARTCFELDVRETPAPSEAIR